MSFDDLRGVHQLMKQLFHFSRRILVTSYFFNSSFSFSYWHFNLLGVRVIKNTSRGLKKGFYSCTIGPKISLS